MDNEITKNRPGPASCLWAAAGLIFALAVCAQAELVQSLTATDGGSIVTNASSQVLQWQDLSDNNNHAVTGDGTVLFSAGSYLNASGRDGLKFSQSSLELFSAADKASILDFNGAASVHSGFAVLLAIQIDDYNSTDWKDLIGTTSALSDTEGFVIRYKNDSELLCILAGSVLRSSGDVLPVGVPIVIALNYNSATGQVDLWNSYDDKTASMTKAAGDFSNGNPFKIGRTTSANRFHSGLIGEVRIYDSFLSPTEFQFAKIEVANAWGVELVIPVSPVPSGVNAMGGESVVDIEWFDISEFEGSYNLYRSTASDMSNASLLAGGLTDSAYLDTNVVNLTTYYYTVTSVGTAEDESPFSQTAAAMPFDEIGMVPPAAPVSLTAVSGIGSVGLDWADNDEPDLRVYGVYRSGTAGGPYTHIQDVVESDYADNSVVNGIKYYYVVTAADFSGNESGYSNEDSAFPPDLTDDDRIDLDDMAKIADLWLTAHDINDLSVIAENWLIF